MHIEKVLSKPMRDWSGDDTCCALDVLTSHMQTYQSGDTSEVERVQIAAEQQEKQLRVWNVIKGSLDDLESDDLVTIFIFAPGHIVLELRNILRAKR